MSDDKPLAFGNAPRTHLRLLHEAGMVLKSKPKAPIHPAVAFAEQFWNTQRLSDNE